MKITATDLRSRLYAVLDQVAETGEVVLIQRRGKTLRIALDEPTQPAVFMWDQLVPRAGVIVGDDDLSDIDWSEQWRPPTFDGDAP